MQVGSRNEESQVRGCYNITLSQSTRKVSVLERTQETKYLGHESKSKE